MGHAVLGITWDISVMFNGFQGYTVQCMADIWLQSQTWVDQYTIKSLSYILATGRIFFFFFLSLEELHGIDELTVLWQMWSEVEVVPGNLVHFMVL